MGSICNTENQAVRRVEGKEVIEELCNLLRQVQIAAANNFSGLGLLICDKPEVLPLLPLRPLSIPPDKWDLIDSLVAISTRDSQYHDGFHVMSSDWRLRRVSQYFSPPIVANVVFNRRRVFGARYCAALFGSAIPEVQLAGIASEQFGIAIFQDGTERHFEAAS